MGDTLKLNNKGFAISSIMYIILVLAVILVSLILVTLSSRKLILDKLKSEVLTTIYEAPNITYRQTIKELKNETIAYMSSNSLEKHSIKVEDLGSSIDSEVLSKYKLNDKYLTAVQNTDSYNVYLGKANTISNTNELPKNTIDVVDYKIYGNSVQEVDTFNIWDGTYTIGSYYDDNGNIVEHPNIAMSNMMNLTYKKYDVTCINLGTGINIFRFNYFDENKNWLSQSAIRVNPSASVVKELEVPVSAKYINFSVLKSQVNNGNKICPSLNNTPTLDSPIEVESVGDKTKNLFNKKTATMGVGLSISTGGTYTDSNLFTSDYIPIKKGVTYFLNWKAKKWLTYYDENKNFLGYTDNTKFTLNNSSYIRFTASIEELDTIQIEEGATATEYEPYGKYKIPVMTRGKNIARPNGITTSHHGIILTTNEDGTVTSTGSATSTTEIVLTWCGRKDNSNYWHDFIVYPNQYIAVSVRNAETGEIAPFKTATQWKGVETGKIYYGSGYMQADEPVYFSRVYTQKTLNEGENIYEGTWKVQVEFGSEITSWEQYVEPSTTNIYLDEPLRKINNYIDYIDLKNKTVVRKVKELELTGAESMSTNPYFKNARGYMISKSFTPNYLEYSKYGFSNYFISQLTNSTLTLGVVFGSCAHIVVPLEMNLLTKEDFSGKLKELYDGGNPVKIYYIMSEENSVNVELPKIQIPEGATEISIDTDIESSSYEFTVIEKIVEI